jgi:hypothetical protein
MTRTTVAVAAGLALFTTLSAAPAWALNGRSFVSAHGLDSNACTLAAPCRTFAVAFANTNAGGEIDVLDTAGYGPLTIDKAISIVNDGAVASVLVPLGGIGITIAAGASDTVSLRGLTIEGGGVGATGVQFNSGQSVTIDNCIIRHLVGAYPAGTALNFRSTAPNSISVTVTNSVLSDNAAYGAVFQSETSGAIKAVLSHMQINNNQWGVAAVALGAPVDVTTYDSVVSRNSAVGLYTDGTGVLKVFHAVVANNNIGVQNTNSLSSLYLAQTMLTSNTTGFDAAAGFIFSFGDNYVTANGSNNGSLTPAGKQ